RPPRDTPPSAPPARGHGRRRRSCRRGESGSPRSSSRVSRSGHGREAAARQVHGCAESQGSREVLVAAASDTPDATHPRGGLDMAKQWTVMVWMAGDNDLEDYALSDVRELKKV